MRVLGEISPLPPPPAPHTQVGIQRKKEVEWLDQYYTALGAEFDLNFLTFIVNPKQAEDEEAEWPNSLLCPPEILACRQLFLSQTLYLVLWGIQEYASLLVGLKAMKKCRGGTWEKLPSSCRVPTKDL